MLFECKKFLDTNIYRSLNILVEHYFQYYKNLRKDIKPIIGKEIFDLMTTCIENMVNSYKSKNNEDKLKYAYIMKDNLMHIEIKTKLLFDCMKLITEEQYTVLCKDYGNIEIQLEHWINKLENI